MKSHRYRTADGRRYLPPPHVMYTADEEYMEALFPESMVAWKALSKDSNTKYFFVINWPHLTVEDGRCWSDMHKRETCSCHVWRWEQGWIPWIKR